MATEIASWLWRRRYRVDESGVSEFYWDGTPRRYIAWNQLYRLDKAAIRSEYGDQIEPKLEGDKSRLLFVAIHTEWRLRFPDACWEDDVRSFRACRRAVFWFIPLMMFIPLLLSYVSLWLQGWPAGWRAEVVRLRSIGILGCVLVAGIWFCYFKWLRPGFQAALKERSGTKRR